MIGAIIGDIVGSVYQFKNIKTKQFPLFARHGFFSDDTVMTIAIFKALQDAKSEFDALSREKKDKLKKSGQKFPYLNLEKHAAKQMQEYGRKYINCGFGNSFKEWVQNDNPKPYNSYGNGSAMRISPVAWFANSFEEVKWLSYKVTAVTHNHPDALTVAEATATAIFMARVGKSKQEIKNYIEKHYFSLNFDYEDLRKNYTFDVSAKNSVPQAIYCFLIGEGFIDSIRTAISIGGDSDTIGAITGSIAEAYYGADERCVNSALTYLDEKLQADYREFSSLFSLATKNNKNS